MALTIAAVGEAIHRGIRNASDKYAKWSGGLTFENSGAEGLLVAEIASALHRQQKAPERLELEVRYKDLLDRSGTPLRRAQDTTVFSGNARADIALFRHDELRYIVEVKRTLAWEQHLTDDLQRLVDAVAACGWPDGTLRRCFFAAYLPGTLLKISNNEKRTSEFFDATDTATGDFVSRVWGDPPQSSICIKVAPQ